MGYLRSRTALDVQINAGCIIRKTSTGREVGLPIQNGGAKRPGGRVPAEEQVPQSIGLAFKC